MKPIQRTIQKLKLRFWGPGSSSPTDGALPGAGLGLSVALVFFFAMALMQGKTFERMYDSSQHDLRAYLACAHNIVAGRHIYQTHHQAIPEDPTLTRDVPKYLYPPLLGMLMIPTTVFPYDTFKHIWFFLNFLFVLHGVFLAVSVLPFGNQRLTAFLLAGGILLGSDMFSWLLRTAQVDGFVLYLSLWSLYLFHRQKWIASALFICVATWLKLTPGIFFVYLIFRGNRRFAIAALTGGLVLGLLQLAVVPRDFVDFFTQTLQGEMPGPMPVPVMQSLWSVVSVLVIPVRGREVFNSPEQFENLLQGLKIAMAVAVVPVLLRRRKDAAGLFLGFAACSCFSLLITDVSWIMRFVANLVTVSAILFFMANARVWWQKAVLLPFGSLLILLNLGFVWTGALGPLLEWKALFIAGPGLHALLALPLLTILFLPQSQWIGPIQSGVSLVGRLTDRWSSRRSPVTPSTPD